MGKMLFVKPADRNYRIGGTDVAVILGKSPYKVREVLIEEKLGRGDPFTGNKFTESGHLYEQVVADWYESQTGEVLVDPVEEAKKDLLPGHVFIHPEHKFLAASPDRLVRNKKRYNVESHADGLIVTGIKFGFEAKTAHFFSKKKWDGLEQKMPEEYVLECQFYMMLSGLDRWDLAVHHLGTADRDIHILEADPFLHEEMLEKCVAFWKELEELREREKK